MQAERFLHPLQSKGKRKMNEIVLSICIPLHNRGEYFASHLREILSVDSREFDIIISDTSDEDRRLEDIASFHDERLKIYLAPATVPAMENWYLALEHADGIFALHLNDRDRLDCKNLPSFIAFLKEHEQYNGGVCKTIDQGASILCDSVQKSVMCIPYFSLHPTGVFFHVERYKAIPDRKEIFTKKYGTHPHDIVLGRLSSYGRLIIYTLSLWKMAPNDFFNTNISGFSESWGKRDFFFEPEQRLKQLTVMLDELQKLDIDSTLKAKKADQVIANYLLLATYNYFYYIESEYQTAHYGIPQRHLSSRQKMVEINRILASFGETLGFSRWDYARYGVQIYKRWLMYKSSGLAKRIPVEAFQKARREWALKKQIRSGTLLR